MSIAELIPVEIFYLSRPRVSDARGVFKGYNKFLSFIYLRSNIAVS